MEETSTKEELGGSVSEGSGTANEYLCDECWEDGNDMEAEGFCIDCQEYLCQDCISAHRKTKLTRRHDLLDKTDMPKDKAQALGTSSQDICTDICPEHRAEVVKYYCAEHDTFGCTVCVTVKHRNCEGVGYIPQLCENLESSDEYQGLKAELQTMDIKFRGHVGKATSNIPKAELFGDNAIETVRQLKQGTRKVMEILEASVKEQVKHMKNEDVGKMNTVKFKAEGQMLMVERIMSKLETFQEANKVCDLFAAMKESKREMKYLQTSLKEMETLNTIREYEFVPNESFLDYLRAPATIGSVSFTDHQQQNEMRAVDTPAVTNPETKSESNDSEITVIDMGQSKSETGAHEYSKGMIKQEAVKENTLDDTTAPVTTSDDSMTARNDTIALRATESKNGLEKGGAANAEDPDKDEVTEYIPEVTEEQTTVDKDSLYLLPRRDESQGTQSPSDITAKHVSDINVKTQTDTSTCYISGCTLLPSDRLLLSDFSNNKVKMFDSVLGYLKDEMTTDTSPWEVTQTADNRVAVTLPYKNKILILKASDTLTSEDEFKVDGNCRGIVCYKDNLVVSYTSPPKLEILDLKGALLRVLVSEERASRLLGVPYHVTARHDDGIFYISDSNDGKVVSLTIDGEVNAECKDLKYPRGVFVDSHGFVYVCARDLHHVYLITPECRNVKTVLTKSDGLWYPMSACCDEVKRLLYIGMNEDNVKIFQLS